MRRWTFALVALAFGLTAYSLAVARPRFVERWALYLGSQRDPAHARLFLDPFPDKISCESRVIVFTRNLEKAFCAERSAFAIDSTGDTILAAEFRVLSAFGSYCFPHRQRPFGRAPLLSLHRQEARATQP
jgi:hypothetical protein